MDLGFFGLAGGPPAGVTHPESANGPCLSHSQLACGRWGGSLGLCTRVFRRVLLSSLGLEDHPYAYRQVLQPLAEVGVWVLEELRAGLIAHEASEIAA